MNWKWEVRGKRCLNDSYVYGLAVSILVLFSETVKNDVRTDRWEEEDIDQGFYFYSLSLRWQRATQVKLSEVCGPEERSRLKVSVWAPQVHRRSRCQGVAGWACWRRGVAGRRLLQDVQKSPRCPLVQFLPLWPSNRTPITYQISVALLWCYSNRTPITYQVSVGFYPQIKSGTYWPASAFQELGNREGDH